jgi:hypothetical protein
MAKKYVIELETKADGTIGTLNDVAKGLEAVASAEKKVASNTEDVTEQLAKLREQLQNTDVKSDQYKELSEQYKKLGGTLEDLVPKTANLKQEQRDLKKALLAGQEALGLEKYTQLTQRLGEVNDQLKDIAESAGQNAGPPLENLSNIAGGLQYRLESLDFDGLNQDIRNVAGNIKNFSLKGIIDGVKGLGGAFSALGKALLANPIFAIAAAIVAVGLAISSFLSSQQEAIEKQNAAIDKNTERRKDNERLAFAQAEGNNRKLTELRLESNKKDMQGTQKKIDNILGYQRRYGYLTKEQEQELADLRDKFRTQEVDREIIKIERINQLNQSRFDLERKFNQLGLTDRQKAQQNIEFARIEEKKRLAQLGASAEDVKKSDEIFREQRRKLDEDYTKEDAANAKSRADTAKQEADEKIALQTEALEAIKSAQDEFNLSGKTEQDKELAAVAEKYKALKEQAEKAKVDTKQIVELQGKEELAIRQKYAQMLIEITKQAQEEQQAVIDGLVEENLTAQKSAQQQELDALGEVYFEKITQLEDAEQDASALRAEWEAKRKAITDKYAQEDVEKEKERQQAVLAAQTAGLTTRQQALANELAAIKADYELRIALARKYGEDTAALEEEFANKQKEARIKASLETVQMWADTASQALDALTSLNEAKSAELGEKLSTIDKQIEEARTAQQRADLIKRRNIVEAEQRKAFEKNKKMQIASATVNTIASAIAAFGSQLIVGDPTSLVRGGIAAAAAAASGALQIAKIKNTQFESSTPPTSSNIPDAGGGGDGGGAEPTTPAFNPLVLDFLNNRPDQQTPRAYVLSGDVEKAANARERVEELARL